MPEHNPLPAPSYDKQNCLQALFNVPLGTKITPQLRTTCLKTIGIFSEKVLSD